MALTYLDQNALIELGRNARKPEFRKRIDAALEIQSFTVVLSSWHLIETSRTANLKNAVELAEFIESLNPKWVYERLDIQKLEVEDDFFKFLRIEHVPKPRVTTLSTVIAALNHQADAPKFDIRPSEFVKQWIAHPEQLKVIDAEYEKHAKALVGLRELTKAGKITDALTQRVSEILFKMALPRTTPAGLTMGRSVFIDYIQQVKPETIPSFAIETAISQHEWATQGGLDGNTLIDKFHLISALSYVDEIVSNDSFFHRLYPEVRKTGHVRAILLGNAEFINRF